MFYNAISSIQDTDLGASEAKRFGVETLAKLLSPMCPHIAEEIWHVLGHETMLSLQKWPLSDDTLAQDQEVEIGIQVLGKLRYRQAAC